MLNETLKSLREKAELSQSDVADKMYCSRSLVAKWEQGRAIPSTTDLKNLSLILKGDYDDLAKEAVPNDVLTFSFATKFMENLRYSWSYLFFPYLLIVLVIVLVYIALGVICGLGMSNHEQRYTYLIVLMVGLIVLSVPLFFSAYNTKKRAQGGVGLAYSRYEVETISLDKNEESILVSIRSEFNGVRYVTSDMKMSFVKECHSYFIVGESRFHSAILPKKYLPKEVAVYLQTLKKIDSK